MTDTHNGLPLMELATGIKTVGISLRILRAKQAIGMLDELNNIYFVYSQWDTEHGGTSSFLFKILIFRMFVSLTTWFGYMITVSQPSWKINPVSSFLGWIPCIFVEGGKGVQNGAAQLEQIVVICLFSELAENVIALFVMSGQLSPGNLQMLLCSLFLGFNVWFDSRVWEKVKYTVSFHVILTARLSIPFWMLFEFPETLPYIALTFAVYYFVLVLLCSFNRLSSEVGWLIGFWTREDHDECKSGDNRFWKWSDRAISYLFWIYPTFLWSSYDGDARTLFGILYFFTCFVGHLLPWSGLSVGLCVFSVYTPILVHLIQGQWKIAVTIFGVRRLFSLLGYEIFAFQNRGKTRSLGLFVLGSINEENFILDQIRSVAFIIAFLVLSQFHTLSVLLSFSTLYLQWRWREKSL